jgi:cytochrome d ubiquinol oxidase subunit II
LAGLVVLRGDARSLYDELVSGQALSAVVVSVLAGLATLVLVYRRRFESARYSAAVAVAAVVAGWALGQWPTILPGLDIREAAAPHDTLVAVAVVVAVLGGGAIVFPSLALLFRLTLAGQLDAGAPRGRAARRGQPAGRRPDCAARPHGGGVSDRRVRAPDDRRCRLGARSGRGGVVRLHDHCLRGAHAGRAPRGAARH